MFFRLPPSRGVRLCFFALFIDIVLSFSLPALADGPDKDPKQPQQTFVVPFTPLVHHGAPIVTLRLNDTEEAQFMVDTGADDCFMSEALAKKMGLSMREATRAGHSISYGILEHPKYVSLSDLKIGHLDLGPANFLVLHNLDSLGKGDTPVSGMIGLTLLARFGVFLDYQRHTMALIYPGKLSNEEVKQLGFADPDATRAPLERLILSGTLYRETEYSTTITLKNGDRTVTVTPYVDTGAPSTTIDRKPAQTLHLEEENPALLRTIATRRAQMSRAQVGELRIGGVVVHGEQLTFPGSSGEGDNFPELLGADVLSYCNVLLDYPNKALYLRPVLPPLVTPPTLDAAKPIDADRLRAAAVSPSLETGIEISGETNMPDETILDIEERIVAVRTALVDGKSTPIEQAHLWNGLAALERRIDCDPAGRREAFQKSADLYRTLLAPNGKPGSDALPALPIAWDDAVKALSDAGQYDESIRWARRAVASATPGSWRPYAALGAALHRKAAFLLSGSNALVWDDVPFNENDFWRLRQNLLKTPPAPDAIDQARKLSEEASGCFDRAVQAAPNDPEVFLARAHYRVAEGVDVAAVLQALHKGSPNLQKFQFDYGVRDDTATASRLKPNDPDLIARVAFLEVACTVVQDAKDIGYRDQQAWDLIPVRTRNAAEMQIERLKLLSTDTTDKARAARAHALLGCIEWRFLTTDDSDTADTENDLKNSISLNGKDTLPLRTLFDLCAGERRYDDILPILKAYAPAQNDAMGYLMLARAAEATGDEASSLAAINKALERLPGDSVANLYKATLLLHQNSADGQAARLAQVLTCLDTARQNLPVSDVSERHELEDAYAVCYGLMGQPAKAQEMALKVLEGDRRDTQAREILAALAP